MASLSVLHTQGFDNEGMNFRPLRNIFIAVAYSLLCVTAWSQVAVGLPAGVQEALKAARLPADALSVVVLPVQAGSARLQHLATQPRNPASLMKLLTTTAALDMLGIPFTWRTYVYMDGPIRDGVLLGNLYVQGSGDPRLGVEQLWLLMRRLQGLGLRHIQGQIVLDRTVFNLPAQDPGGFDGEPLRPYNAAPDGLLINFKSLLLQFTPDPVRKVAHVHVEPPLAGVKVQTSVPLSTAECGDYRSGLKADFQNPLNMVFAGSYPLSCGEKTWPLAYTDPDRFAARAIHGMWLHLGGQLTGSVRDGVVPQGLKPVLFHESPTLAEVVRDINKFSNNVMAEQLFLTLAVQKRNSGTPAMAVEVLQDWWRDRIQADLPQLDKGSGLSRESRISAQALAALLQWAWTQPFMPELLASLPLTGQDGTLKRSKSSAAAHLKTGSLRDVMGIAGYVDAANGQRYVLVAMVNHANASQARPVMDALIDWTAGKDNR